MTEKKRSTPDIWNDPDDAPELTAEIRVVQALRPRPL